MKRCFGFLLANLVAVGAMALIPPQYYQQRLLKAAIDASRRPVSLAAYPRTPLIGALRRTYNGTPASCPRLL